MEKARRGEIGKADKSGGAGEELDCDRDCETCSAVDCESRDGEGPGR